MKILTVSQTRDMSEESGDLPLRVIRRTTLAEPRIRIDGTKEGAARVEAPPGAFLTSLIKNSIEEILGHNIRHRNTPTRWRRRRIAGASQAAGATVILGRPTVPILAATHRCTATAVLSQRRAREGSSEDPNKKDCYQLDSHLKRPREGIWRMWW